MERTQHSLAYAGIMLLFMLAAALPLVTIAQDDTPEPTAEATAEATAAAATAAHAALEDTEGNAVGDVTITQTETGQVIVQVMVNNLPSGFHGFHIHETGQCDASTEQPFSSAGGHLNPDGAQHDDHAGDLPTLLVMSDGTGGLLAITDRFTLADLLDDDGSAVVVHELADNFANIPERYGGADEETLKAGDSGSRIACGVITAGGMQAAG